MTMNLSIKNVPAPLVEALRARAERHHRSLQGELMVILEESLTSNRTLTPSEFVAEIRRMGVSTPSESAAILREERDAR